MPRICAADQPTTTAGKWVFAALRNSPSAMDPPKVHSSPGSAAATLIPPLCWEGIAAVR
jgi:hypothetical protein